MKTLDINIPKPSKWFSLSHLRSKPKSPTPPLSPSRPKTATKEADYQDVFHFFDKNGDGKISTQELITYFRSIGDSVSQSEAQRVISEFDVDGDNLLDFEDFVKLMERDKEEGGSGEDDHDLKRAFEMFEDEKGSGCITPKGLQQVLNLLGDEKSYEECEAMIKVFDVDGNGVLDFHEFHKMMA